MPGAGTNASPSVMKKTTFKRIYLYVLLLSVFGCVQEQSHDISSEDKLTVETARYYYEKAQERAKTKAISGHERTNMFFREAYSENWEQSLLSQTDVVESVDVPLNEQRQYYVISRDGKGYYLTRCHHSLSIVRSAETGAIGVYHHFFIPFRHTNDAFGGSYDGRLYGNFRNNGDRENYTGLELYFDTEGNIVKFLRYYRGKRYEDRYYGDGSTTKEIIAYQMRYYIKKAYGIKSHIKTKGDHTTYSCPDCGFDLRESGGILSCDRCPWSELDFYDQEIDECIFYGDAGGSGNGGGWDFPDPVFPQQPDPNTGGGGGGGGSGNVGGPGIPEGFFYLDAKAERQIAPVLQRLMEDCAASSIISSLSKSGVKFENVNGQFDIAKMVVPKTSSEPYHIKYFVLTEYISEYALLEELYHCFQHLNGNYSKSWHLNLEVEAKYAIFLYLEKHGDLDEMPSTGGTDVEIQCFRDYKSHKTEENYLRLVNFVRNLGPTYANMSENQNHRSMPQIGIFKCYEE